MLSALMWLSASCVREEAAVRQEGAGKTGRLTVVASINGTGRTATRAELLSEVPEGGTSKGVNRDDLWSYWQFSTEDKDGDGKEDQLGFFAQYGGENGGPVNNASMTYEDVESPAGSGKRYGVFTSDGNVDLSKLADGGTYFYFPYDPHANTTGIELRRKDLRANFSGDPLKCLDFLQMEAIDDSGMESDGVMGGELYHGFSELIIMRGEGFDNPKGGDYTIKVYLKEPYSHLVIEPQQSGNAWTCVPKLIFSPGSVTNGTALNSNEGQDYHVWEAWKGYNYGITDMDAVGREAWYVILPTVGTGNSRTEVDYIELIDNDGVRQRVSSLRLSNDKNKASDPDNFTKKLTSGWRYPMEISMQELVPTVNPYPIVAWGEEQTITDERARGINDLNEYQQWLAAYNSYLKDGRKDEGESEADGDQTMTHMQQLLKYGDRVVDEVTHKVLYWHFYLRADLDLSVNEGFEIDELQDVLDGRSDALNNSVFQNHKITGLQHPFIKTLTGPYAAVQNIDFSEPEINNPSETNPIGIVAQEIADGGLVDKCNVIKGTILTGGPVGMVAGSIEGGTRDRKSRIANCNLSGFIFGTQSVDKIVGEKDNDAVEEGNNAASVIFNDKNN